jgi:hypothetical protein
VSTTSLVTAWRNLGPVGWAQSPHGWLLDNGRPITLELWQAAVLNAWWAQPEDVTLLGISHVKKTGKTLANAVLLAWRWLALPGEHFAAANDLDQAAGRQFSMIADMVRRNPYLSKNCRADRTELEFLPTRSIIRALSVNAAADAGANHLTVSHTEAWGVIYEAGIRAYEELSPPPGKTHGLPCLRICDSYAGYAAESKTWHDIVDRGLSGELVSDEWPIYREGGLLLFHMAGEEAQVRCFRGTPEERVRYYNEQRLQLRPGAFRRQHLNERAANESQFVTREAWEACRDAVTPLVAGDGRRLVLGADASTSRDLTALVGTVWDPALKAVTVPLVRVWKPLRGDRRGGKPTVDLEATIGQEVSMLHRAGQVECVICDPYQLHTLVLDWERQGIRVVELPQNAGRVEADSALADAIAARLVRHYGDPDLTDAILNAIAVETPRGLRLAKEKAALKIDLAVALSMAVWGLTKDQGFGPGVPNGKLGEAVKPLEQLSRWGTTGLVGGEWRSGSDYYDGSRFRGRF